MLQGQRLAVFTVSRKRLFKFWVLCIKYVKVGNRRPIAVILIPKMSNYRDC